MVKKTGNKWFLFCTSKDDGSANETISEALSNIKGFNSDFSQLECADGETRHLYEVPDCSFARRFVKNRFEVEIFFSKDDGKPQQFALPIKRKITLVELAERSEKIKRKMAAKSATRHRQR